MGFLKKLFGGEKKQPGENVDTRGVYFYVQCDNCGSCVRLRADKEYDLVREDGGFVWHKTIVDNRCFRRMPTFVNLDSRYNVVHAEITGGKYISESAYNTWLNRDQNPEPEDGSESGDKTETDA